jgi:7,8-dihydropterin-6-yl-methyl-4-(beta-D-ribofuranosyl)aminobenzene 5'-phosphate synthase
MRFRAAPWTWPLMTAAAPVLAPLLAVKHLKYRQHRARAARLNSERLARAAPLELPELERLELTVLSEHRHREGFRGEPAVSYLLRTDQGSLLFDVGFGADVLAHNAARLGISLQHVDAVAISHWHLDHAGGMQAMRSRSVMVPDALGDPAGQPCFLPDRGQAPGFAAHVVEQPRLLAAGVASTGPLARSLFFFGWTEEQALLARLHGKGLVLISGCGHPTAQLMLEMVSRLSAEPVFALVGGYHFPVTGGRTTRGGLDVQTIMGTGKPPWQRITDAELDQALASFRRCGASRLLLSAHDTCDHALQRIAAELDADVQVLQAGGQYTL